MNNPDFFPLHEWSAFRLEMALVFSIARTRFDGDWQMTIPETGCWNGKFLEIHRV